MTEEERASLVQQLASQTEYANRLGAVVTGFLWKNGRLSVQMAAPPRGCGTEAVETPPVNGYAKVERKRPTPTQDRLL